MQFMPETWAGYGVDANGDGVKDPLQPRRRDLRRRQLPQRRRHAHRHLRRDLRLQPRRLVRQRGPRQRRLLRGRSRRRRPSPPPAWGRRSRCCAATPAPDWKKEIPADYLERLRERRRPLRTRQARRLGARRDRPPRVELRQGDGQTGAAPGRRRSASTRASGTTTRSTATTTGTSATATSPTRRRRWRGRSGRAAASRPASSPTTRPSGTCRRCSKRPNRSKAAARSATSTGESRRWPTGFETARPRPRSSPATASPAPRRRAAGGQGGDRRGQLDRHHPLRLGRRPRLLVLLRLRLLRRGQLRPLRRRPARHAAHLRLAGELRRTGPRHVDHDLRQRHPRLRGDRRAALGHGRRRIRDRAAMARRASLSGRVRRPAPDRVLSVRSGTREAMPLPRGRRAAGRTRRSAGRRLSLSGRGIRLRARLRGRSSRVPGDKASSSSVLSQQLLRSLGASVPLRAGRGSEWPLSRRLKRQTL